MSSDLVYGDDDRKLERNDHRPADKGSPVSGWNPPFRRARAARPFPEGNIAAVSHLLTEKLGERVRHYRERVGLSQADVAAGMDEHQTTIGQIERGDIDPLFSLLVCMARVLGADVGELMICLPSPCGHGAVPGGNNGENRQPRARRWWTVTVTSRQRAAK